ncbi:MAG: extracellular solute-binding protein [Gammaproteobacteria bacterium]|nr:extracellular solute-binding protein [Gammaproteobacteria bacterium]
MAWVVIALAALAGCAPTDSSLVVYSSRNEELIKPVFDIYSEMTGVEISYVTDDAGPLVERLRAEGANTPADLLLTVDAGNLWYAAEQDILRSVDSATLQRNIPAYLRDEAGRWFGLSLRARTIVYSKDRVDPGELSTYAALGDEKWRGRLCLRTSRKVYNQSLVAMLIAQDGEARTEQTVRSWVDNLATDVFSNDTALMQAMVAGQCDVGIVNSYYFGRLQEKNPEIALALFWPDQQSSGVHVNVSGAGVTRHAPHAEKAIAFLEWLSTDVPQRIFAERNHEYPANPAVDPDPLVSAWGEFKASETPLSKAGELQSAAVRLMDRAGYR